MKARFILNPKAGTRRREMIFDAVENWCVQNEGCETVYTREKGDGFNIAREAAGLGFDITVAVGGDGSVNEVAGALIGSRTALGIIPCGSGNGVARHFGIPSDINRSLAIIQSGQIKKIDTCTVNGRPFLMLAGAGFDAYVAKLFNQGGQRGLMSYIKISASGYFRFRQQQFRIKVDGITMVREAFAVVAANCSQFGNNATIAPGALADDGLINLTILKKAPAINLPALGWQLFTSNLVPGKYVEMLAGKHIVIQQEEDYCQVDGDYYSCGRQLDIHINPGSLNMILP